MTLISVIDCETTGLNAARSDRIIEIAVVVIDTSGAVSREFVSLVNPGRDVGKTSLHGISASDVADAPAFQDIMGHVTEVLDGTIALAAHNVGFDYRFLRSEFQRAGTSVPTVSTLCTMRLSGGGTLECCCRDMGIDFDTHSSHCALQDARAAAKLLAHLCEDGMLDLAELAALSPTRWPKIPSATAAPLSRVGARSVAAAPPSYIQHLLSHAGPFPNIDISENIAIEYLGTLERALEDRHVNIEEGEALVSLARTLELDGNAIARLHRGYLERLIAAAQADGVVTPHERRDIETVGHLLGFDDKHIRDTLARNDLQHAQLTVAGATGDGDCLVGKRVCFTGESVCCYQGQPITRERAAAIAATAGLVIAESVTKKLDILIVADPHSQSGKARKARQYGTRIIHEPVFWKMLGINVD